MCKGLSQQQQEILVRINSLGSPQHAADLESIFWSRTDDPGKISSARRKVLRANAKRSLLSLEKRGFVTTFYDRASPEEWVAPNFAAVLTKAGADMALHLR